jgi:hypothetical protein
MNNLFVANSFLAYCEITFIVHELGHLIVWGFMRVFPKRISYKSWHKIPIFLGIEYNTDIKCLTNNQKFSGAISGPAANVILGLAAMPYSYTLSTLSLCFAAINLVPVKGTDGWRIAKCL